MTDALSVQYEAYPYPARDPRDEDRRLVIGSPGHLDEVNHYGFGGRLDFARPLRVLFAGGGTGDGTIMMAQQCRDAGLPAEITYLDLSTASRAIAEERARRRGLSSIRFLTGSLLDLGRPGLDATGPFDYVDCCGVLHHLEDPAEGLRSLLRVLAPGGAIGIMVYAPYGRTGVYELQDALRQLAPDLPPAGKVDLAKKLLAVLPPTNRFARNPHLGDHRRSDAGLYDLLLHSRDRAYTVPELFGLAEAAGLAVTALIEPARYEPATYLGDAALAKRAAALSWPERAALAERLSGSIAKHVCYLARPEDAAGAVARLDGGDPSGLGGTVPVLRDLDGVAVARALKPGAGLKADMGGVAVTLPLPRLAGPMLARIDGRTDLAGLHRGLLEIDRGLTFETFASQFGQLYRMLNGVNKLLLRRPRR